jgi:ribosomal protein S18 acetylase RimI-like enzyme
MAMNQDEITYRRAAARDVESIVALVELAYRGEASRAGWSTEADLLDGQRTDAAAVLEIVDGGQPSRVVLVEDAAGTLIGCCQLELRTGGVAYFGMFAVSPLLQGTGIGRQVLSEAERIARDDWRAHTMQMTVLAQREELIEWYARRGYSPTGDTVPFPYGDARFGLPRRDDLVFWVLAKPLVRLPPG